MRRIVLVAKAVVGGDTHPMMMRRVALVLWLLVPVLLIATGGPADAGVCLDDPAPGDGDARIRLEGASTYLGDGVYGANQTISVMRPTGEKAVFEAKVRNDSDEKQAVIVIGAPQNNDVKYKVLKGDKNITDKVRSDDGKKFKDIKPGDSTPKLRMKIEAISYLTSPERGFLRGMVKSYGPPPHCSPDTVVGQLQKP